VTTPPPAPSSPEPEPSANPAPRPPAPESLPPAGEPEPPAAADRSFGEHLRDAIQDSTVTVTVLALVAAVVLGGLLAAFTNDAVLHAWSNFFSAPGNAIAKAWAAAAGTYVALFEGSVFNPHTVAALFQQASIPTAIHDGYLGAVFGPLSETAVQATPLILTGLAVALPYQAGMFNIGGQSQFIGGAILSTWLGYAVNLPFFVHVVVCVLGGFVGGAAIGWLAGEIKARTGAHEVIVTIMLNYVMAYFLAYLLSSKSLMQGPGGSNNITQAIASNAHLPLIAGHLRLNVGFLIALACAFGVWWLLNRTTTGFEFRSVGANASASRVAGMNVERNWALVMLIGGGLAGLAAATVIMGTEFTLNPQSFGTYGIDAITVALLGLGRPGGVVAAGLLFGALHAGSPGMQVTTGTPVQIVSVIQALIVLFVAAPPLVRAVFRLRAARARGVSTSMSKGWNA
jgi:simple sugar transport system permease protein